MFLPTLGAGNLEWPADSTAMEMTNWELAAKKVLEWESGAKEKVHVTLADAINQFIGDAEARNLAPVTRYKYRFTLEKKLKPYCDARNIVHVDEIGVADIIGCRKLWTESPITKAKRFERLRSFFLFCERNGWCGNPCRGLKPPKVEQKPTMPFTDEEMKRILDACEKFGIGGRYKSGNRTRVKAFILTMRHTGLRIGDTILLSKEKIQNGKVFVTTEKTGTQVWVPVPEVVLAALKEIEGLSRFYFWNGKGTLKSAVSVWTRTLKRLFELAEIPDGHSHRLRNTFAVSLLLRGVPIEDVAVLLGHQDVKVTWKSYSPFVKARQDRLEERVRATW